MDIETYEKIASSLSCYEDVKRVSAKFNTNEQVVLSIYNQKVVRDAKKRYYAVKSKASRLHKRWKNGESLLQIAKDIRFPPVITAQIILNHEGITRKKYWKMIRFPQHIPDARLRKELAEVAAQDHVYSPRAMELQYKMGRWGEEKLRHWLEEHKIAYRPESVLRKKYKKTPDVLLAMPMIVDGAVIHWIESKASFGDKYEVRRHVRKQFLPYIRIFGPGAVVYWFGHVEGLVLPEGVKILPATFFGGEHV